MSFYSKVEVCNSKSQLFIFKLWNFVMLVKYLYTVLGQIHIKLKYDAIDRQVIAADSEGLIQEVRKQIMIKLTHIHCHTPT